jgi:hypothetical protein
MNRRQSKDFLSGMESKYRDAVYRTEFRWLSRSRCSQACVVKSEIGLFRYMKRDRLHEICDQDCTDRRELNV